MKINWFLFCIALIIAALAAYGFFAANGDEPYRLVITAGAFLSLFTTFAGMIALRINERGGANMRIVSALFFIVLLVEHLVFTFVPLFLPPYIIITGILLLLYLLAAYAIAKALQHAK
jgi:hypothetical protein